MAPILRANNMGLRPILSSFIMGQGPIIKGPTIWILVIDIGAQGPYIWRRLQLITSKE